MNAAEAIAFVQTHGVVLASAKGPAPRLIDAIAGEPIRGNWWSHPKARAIYAVLRNVSDSDEILVCRLLGGKITLVHRRLWPALVCAAGHFPAERLARVQEEHTPKGRHETHETPFPDWVPREVEQEAQKLSADAAIAALGAWARDG